MKKIAIFMVLALLLTSCGSNSANEAADDVVSNEANYSVEYSEEVTEEATEETAASVGRNTESKIDGNEWFAEEETDNWWSSGETDEDYKSIVENRYKSVLSDPLSTFSIDVDTASYSNIRRYLQDGELPPEEAVRIEEMVNYFKYDHKKPQGSSPIAITTEIGRTPWDDRSLLLMVGLQAADIPREELPRSNIVFLLDVSGSMNDPDKLPLLKKAFSMLVENLEEDDRVSVVVYAGSSGVVLNGSRGSDKDEIINAINDLRASGSTAGSKGINRAYELAERYYIEGGNNRVILATDGDFNVGISSDSELIRFIEDKRDSGVFLSVLGFGTGNLKDNKMESLADHGNGTYSYIDSVLEAKKVLVNELYSTLYTLAKDTKIQIEFNPSKVREYRLIGYENRMLENRDFNDDSKDAGEIGVGHSVTAFYEIIPYDSESNLKYQNLEVESNDLWLNEWLEVRVRYKRPNRDTSELLVVPVSDDDVSYNLSDDFKFASSVIEFGMILKDSRYLDGVSFGSIIKRAKESKGYDKDGYRAQFIHLVETAEALKY